MRTLIVSTLICVAALSVAGCTVKDIDAPALAGPSTLAHSIQMTADRDTLTQNGVDFVDIRVTSIGPNGQSETIPLRAQIYVDGVPQDFGVLSTKTPITPATIRYTAPAGSPLATVQSATTVTIGVTPTSSGDFRGEMTRQIDLKLLPQGIILPTNPNLIANFTFAPTTPLVLQNVSFDASTSTNAGVACNLNCTYAWDFGDASTAAGQAISHSFVRSGTFIVTLTVTDGRGATATSSKPVVVAPPAVPTAVDFTVSPSNPGTNQTIFFNASASRAAAGRTLVSYEWDFGKGTTGSGVTVTKLYETPGTYTVTLKVTDDAGAIGSTSKTVTVGGTASLPVAVLTFSPVAPTPGASVFFDGTASTPASAPITQYRFIWGDGTETVGTSQTASHTFTTGVWTVRLTVTDSEGRQGTTTKDVAVK
jgi:PKD repeat protein